MWAAVAIVIAPSPFVTLIPVPAVKVALSKTLAVLSYINKWPAAGELILVSFNSTKVSSVAICASTYVLIAFADANVSSLPDTEDISVSSTPDFKLSTSIFESSFALTAVWRTALFSVSLIKLPPNCFEIAFHCFPLWKRLAF